MEEEKSVVDVRKQNYRQKHDGKDLEPLVRAMVFVRGKKDDLEAQLAEVNAEFDVLRIELIPAKMEEQGIENIRYEGIGRVSLTADMWCHVQDKQGLFGWFRKNRLKDLITETVNSSTLKAFVKDRMKAGKATPPAEVLKVEPYTRASITKG